MNIAWKASRSASVRFSIVVCSGSMSCGLTRDGSCWCGSSEYFSAASRASRSSRSFQHLASRSKAIAAQLGVGVDGEVVDLKTPLYYESLPGALRVLAPANSETSG